MRERLIGVGHSVRVFPFLDRIAAIVGCVHQLCRQTIDHRLVVAAARGVDDPANGKRLAALRADLDRHLIGCASDPAGANLDRRVAYITALSVDMLQVLARPEPSSLKDLNGKKMNVFPKGSVIPIVLKTLGVEIEEVNLSIPDGIQQMRNGEVHATACFCSVPIPAYAAVSSDLGFKLLEVPYTAALEESFLPASLSSETYPTLIARGSRVQTLGTHLLLVTYNWAPGTDRYRKVEKFVDAFFSHLDKLRQPPRHPAWRDVNIAATVPGWQRFAAAQRWLDRQAAEAAAKAPPSSIDPAMARAQAANAAPHDRAEQERLFKEFLEWARRQPKR